LVVQPSPLKELSQSRNSYRPASNFGRKCEQNTKSRNIYFCGLAEESTEGDGDAAARVEHAVKGGDGEEEEDVGAAVALPHAVAPVGAPSVYCCGGERSVHCYGGAEASKGGDWEEEKDGDAAAALPHAVTPVGTPSVHSCSGAEETKRCDGDAAARFAFGNWRLAAKQGSQMAWSATTDVVSQRVSCGKRGRGQQLDLGPLQKGWEIILLNLHVA
jgi:hypothetical protein